MSTEHLEADHEARLTSLLSSLTAGEPTAELARDALDELRLIPSAIAPQLRVQCLLEIGRLLRLAERYVESLQPYDLAASISRREGYLVELRKALTWKTTSLYEMGAPLREWLVLLEEALAIAEKLDDPIHRSIVYSGLGIACRQAGMCNAALRFYNRAIDALPQEGSDTSRYRAVTTNNIADILLLLKNTEEAYQVAKAAVELFESSPPDRATLGAISSIYNNFFAAALRTGHIAEATKCLEKQERIATTTGGVRARVVADICRAELLVARGKQDEGLRLGEQALELARCDCKLEVDETMMRLAWAYERADNHDRALSLRREAARRLRSCVEQSLDRMAMLDPSLHGGQVDLLTITESEQARSAARADPFGGPQLTALREVAYTCDQLNDMPNEHGLRVGRLAAAFAGFLGREETYRAAISMAGELHDVGKIAVPERVLQKAGPLTTAERRAVEVHASSGADLVAKIDMEQQELIVNAVRHHHERWDGGGYPDALSGSGIPEEARVIALCDVFASLVSDAPQRQAWTPRDALQEIEYLAGLQFDPQLTERFTAFVNELLASETLISLIDGHGVPVPPFLAARKRVAALIAAW